MPHPTKKQRLDDHRSVAVADSSDFLGSFDNLSVDELADVLAFLPVENIFRLRRLNKKTREAVKITTVPFSYFWVNSMKKYNAMTVMTTEMPNLQQIMLCDLNPIGRQHLDRH